MQLGTVSDVFPRKVPETTLALERPNGSLHAFLFFLVELSSESGVGVDLRLSTDVVVVEGLNLLV
jgi:hypothetical protein